MTNNNYTITKKRVKSLEDNNFKLILKSNGKVLDEFRTEEAARRFIRYYERLHFEEVILVPII